MKSIHFLNLNDFSSQKDCMNIDLKDTMKVVQLDVFDSGIL